MRQGRRLIVWALPVLILILLAVLGGARSSVPAANFTESGIPEECDRVVHVDCYPGMWENTGREWCSFSLACVFSLPPFSGHFIEQEQRTVCHFRCENGYAFTKTYYRRRDLRVGCCGGGLPGGRNPGEEKTCPRQEP